MSIIWTRLLREGHNTVRILTEDVKQEFQDFRNTLEELGLDEECYHKITTNGKQLLAQMAAGMEATTAQVEAHYPQFGHLIKGATDACVSQYDYMFRLLENYMDPDVDDPYSFKRDRDELLLALRNDFFPAI